jgi:penicillin amidase
MDPVWTTPLSNRSTYAHVVEFGCKGPVRIESMFPLGESGNILMDSSYAPVFDEHFFSMTPEYDAFAPREFPLFTKMEHGKK